MSDRSYIDQQDHATAMICQEAAVEQLHRARTLNRPHALYRPQLFQDGNAWCALLGEDIAVGVTGWGATPDAAMQAFDEAWTTKAIVPAPKAQGRVLGGAQTGATEQEHEECLSRGDTPEG